MGFAVDIQRTQAHVGFHLFAGLTLLAQAAPIGLSVPWFGETLAPNLYAIIIAPSAEGCKTTAIKIARRLLLLASEKRSSRPVSFNEAIVCTPPGSSEALVDYFSATPGADPRKFLIYDEFGELLQASSGSAEAYVIAVTSAAVVHRLIQTFR